MTAYGVAATKTGGLRIRTDRYEDIGLAVDDAIMHNAGVLACEIELDAQSDEWEPKKEWRPARLVVAQHGYIVAEQAPSDAAKGEGRG